MDNRIDRNIMTALLKSVYRQDLISEDVYNYSLNNIEKALDYRADLRYDVLEKEVASNGYISN